MRRHVDNQVSDGMQESSQLTSELCNNRKIKHCRLRWHIGSQVRGGMQESSQLTGGIHNSGQGSIANGVGTLAAR